MDFKEFLKESLNGSQDKLSNGDIIEVIKKAPILDRLARVFYGKDAYNIRPGFKFTITGIKDGMYTVVTSDSGSKDQFLSKKDIERMLKMKLIKIN